MRYLPLVMMRATKSQPRCVFHLVSCQPCLFEPRRALWIWDRLRKKEYEKESNHAVLL